MDNPIDKTMNQVIKANSTNTHFNEKGEHICPHCNRIIPKIKLECLGRKYEVQPVCSCESGKELQEIQKLTDAHPRHHFKQFSLESLGERFKDSTFDKFIVRDGSTKTLEVAKDYAEHFEEWGEESLLIWGTYGNGKSHLAGAIANYLNSKNKLVIFQSVPDLLEKIRRTFNKNNDSSESDILNYLSECHLLILDDIGAEKVTDWVQDVLFRIIDGRYRNKKPILYTSNLKPSLLSEKIGERIYDRINETNLIIENKANSFRKEKAKKRYEDYRLRSE